MLRFSFVAGYCFTAMLSGAYALDMAAGRHMLVGSGIECTASTLLPAMNCPIWNDHMQLFSCPRRFALC